MHRLPILLIFCLLVKAGFSQIVINEAGIAPSGVAGSEFIELYNRSGCTIDLSCYTLVFSSTSGGGNPTGWTLKIPSGKTIAAGGYFLIGGTAGTMGVSAGTGYPTGGIVNSYPGVADVDVGTTAFTANAVYMKQTLSAGSLPNASGQLSLLDASGSLVWSVSYNNGNNPGTYPLSAYTTCNASGNTQGINNIGNPGASVNNVAATFTAGTNQGIYLNSSGNYQTETTLSPRASNATNGGTQICSGPVLTSVSNVAACFSQNNQTIPLPYSASNSPVTYTITWNPVPVNTLPSAVNATIGSTILITIPANAAPNVYTGYLTVTNTCGSSCTLPFTLTINAKPVVTAGTYSGSCINGAPVALTGLPAGGIFSGFAVSGSTFVPPPIQGSYSINYSYTDLGTGCSNTASAIINISAPGSSYTTACTTTVPYLFSGQSFSTTGLHTVPVSNSNGCTDTAKLYLVVKQSLNIDTSGCDSLIYEGGTYHKDTVITQTVSSVVTACDSVVKNIRIRVKRSTVNDTTVCLPVNGSLTLLAQTFTTSGDYILHTANTLGCDSMIRLHLIVATLQNIDTTGCDSVAYNGIYYTNNTTISEIIPSAFSGCDSVIKSINIYVKKKTASFATACINSGGTYVFNGMPYTVSGVYTATLVNAQGCDSLAQLYLVAAIQQTINLTSCHPVTYNSIIYTTSAIIYDTIKSIATNCDSLIKKVVISISPQLFTVLSVCVNEGDVYSFNGQLISSGGHYTTMLTTAAGCDSIIQLYAVFRKTIAGEVSGCDSVIFKGVSYYNSTVISDTIRSVVIGCDSIIYTTNITINLVKHTYITACLLPGESYQFNGQAIMATGNYTTMYRGVYCDSIVHLYLLVARQETITIQGCKTVSYNGITYTSSVTLQNNIQSAVLLCDSVLQIINISISTTIHTYRTACINQGESYLFNGQLLSNSGTYTALYNSNDCDSLVHLYLLVTATKTQMISGCDSAFYNGTIYTSSTVISDTVHSIVTSCDSIINVVRIQVNKKPILQTSGNATICKGDSILLGASSVTGSVNWIGFGQSDTIAVSPLVTTSYTVVTTDASGCSNKVSVTVSIQDFTLEVFATPPSVLSGKPVFLQTVSVLPYRITSWSPTTMFINQTSKTQSLIADSSISIIVTGVSDLRCKDTASVSMIVIPLNDVYIPSGFTPNGDGRNEKVRVYGTGIKELDFKIFNRWGQMIFYTRDKGNGWDGKLAGILQPAGTYVFAVRVKKSNGQVVEKKGTVTLIR